MRTHDRPRCPACRKHPQVCLCTGIEPRDSAHRVVIVQHPGEVWRPSSTAGLVTRLYPRSCDLVIRGEPEGEERLAKLLAEPGVRAYLLFPDPGAPEAGALAAARGGGERRVFVVLDGSWRQARRMRRRHPLLATLPVVRLDPAAVSAYRVRRQTAPSNLSTAEAVALLLGRLDGLPGPDPALITLFDDWIDRVVVLRGLAARRPRPVRCDVGATGTAAGVVPAGEGEEPGP